MSNFTVKVKLCKRCKGEQFIRKTMEGGRKIDAWCPDCKGSGFDLNKYPTARPAFIFAK